MADRQAIPPSDGDLDAAARQPLAPRGLRARRTFWGVTGKPSLGSNAFSRWRETKAAVRHVIGAVVSEKMKKVMRVEKEEGLPDLHHHGMDRPHSRTITSRPSCGLRRPRTKPSREGLSC